MGTHVSDYVDLWYGDRLGHGPTRLLCIMVSSKHLLVHEFGGVSNELGVEQLMLFRDLINDSSRDFR